MCVCVYVCVCMCWSVNEVCVCVCWSVNEVCMCWSVNEVCAHQHVFFCLGKVFMSISEFIITYFHYLV